MPAGCGFPEITLDGTEADWIRVKAKTSYLLRNKVGKLFGFSWGRSLLPLLDRFIDAFDVEIDCLFWNSMIKRGSTGSGGFSFFSGWINILFPFMGTFEKNVFCVPYSIKHAYVKQGLERARYRGVDPGRKREAMSTIMDRILR